MDYDFSGYASRNNLQCADGRIIIRDAFKANDGMTVPLIWNHRHDSPDDVIGHALLENRADGVYTYGKFNDTKYGKIAKIQVESGDITGLSIWANNLRQNGNNVIHGAIREVSLVLAGANPGAYIDTVLVHGDLVDNGDDICCVVNDGSFICHSADSDTETIQDVIDTMNEKQKSVMTLIVAQALEDAGIVDEDDDDNEMGHGVDYEEDEDMGMQYEDEDDDETVQDIIDTMNEKQKTVMYALVGQALEDDGDDDDDDEEDEEMKHNLFDSDYGYQDNVLTHADQDNIISLAKDRSVGSLQTALNAYVSSTPHLAHGIDDIDVLFPDYKDVYPGAPELIERDQGWVSVVMNKASKSPISRIRTRQSDIRPEELRAFGYQKGDQKAYLPNFKLLKRTTDPQTIHLMDKLDRDDILDITDFDVVDYIRGIMKQNLNEEIAIAIMIGDGREEGDSNHIDETHIRSIWNDDELYCIHTDVDIEAAREELQGTNTSANFGENYIYAEAIVTSSLYAREKYKGKGTPDFFCTPHLLNVMLLARDLNGRRIYDSKSDLAAALNVNEIYTAEQFEGRTRTDSDGNTKKLLGIFVNLDNYQIGCVKGGEVTTFNQFDIDFNQEKYLIETRISGALTRVYSAIALEELATVDAE